MGHREVTAGRPRNPSTPTALRECPVHGEVEHRRHKVGTRTDRNGEQKYLWRCPQCHSKAVRDAQKRAKEA